MKYDLQETQVEQAPQAEQVPKSLVRQILEMVALFAVMLLLLLGIEHFLLQPVEVKGISMETTLSSNNHLLLEKVTYYFEEPKRYDIVVFRPYENEKNLYYIKRIIGMPGETILIKDNQIYVDGIALEENNGLEEIIQDEGIASKEVTLGEDEYFVMGDNRNRSKDSRDKTLGPIKRSSIVGRAFIRIWPLNKITVLRHS